VSVEEPVGSSSVPSATALSRIYPNPFNPSTTVAFDLAEQGWVNLEVHDARGALVRVLADRHFGPGTYEVVWNGRETLDAAWEVASTSSTSHPGVTRRARRSCS
jgi:hypothetical protein